MQIWCQFKLEKYLKEYCEAYNLVEFIVNKITHSTFLSISVWIKFTMFHRTIELDVLKWWKVNSTRFLVLASIAREVLAIPVSTIAFGFVFSMRGRILDLYSICLTSKIIEVLVCTQDWIKLMPFTLLSEEHFEKLKRFEQGDSISSYEFIIFFLQMNQTPYFSLTIQIWHLRHSWNKQQVWDLYLLMIESLYVSLLSSPYSSFVWVWLLQRLCLLFASS